MTISNQSRYGLHQRLTAVLGREEAATLMGHLPPVGWADVATKRDLDHLALVTTRDIDHLAIALRSETATGFAGVHSEISDLRVELLQEMNGLRAETCRQLPTLLLGLVGLQVSAAGLLVALSRLL